MEHVNAVLPAAFAGLASVLLTSAALAAESAPAAILADPPNDPESALEFVTVTATRKVTDLQSTPVAVSAFSGDELERRNVREFADLMDSIPNVLAPKSLNGAGASVTIRGIGSNARLALGNGVEQPAGAYL